MKLLIAIGFTFALIAPAWASPATPQFEPVEAFRSLVASASEPKEWSRVYQNGRTQKWGKQFYSIGEVKYDVKRTDSLISPVIGIVTFPFTVRQSEMYDSKEDADKAESPSTRGSLSYRIQATYNASDSGWHVSEFKYIDIGPDSRLAPTNFTLSAQQLRGGALGDPLRKWIVP